MIECTHAKCSDRIVLDNVRLGEICCNLEVFQVRTKPIANLHGIPGERSTRVACLLNMQALKELLAAAPRPEKCPKHWEANIPLCRVIDPGQICELAAFSLSDRSACVTGANTFADGGMTSQFISKEPYQSQAIERR